MKLVIDIGNSDIVLAAKTAAGWLTPFRHPTREAEAWSPILQRALTVWQGTIPSVDQVVVSSVVPPATSHLLPLLQEADLPAPLLLGPDHFRAMGVLQAEEIGSDLVANATAGYARFGAACVVIDFGTALTFTIVGPSGEILGVNIAPGIKTAMKALFSNTAQLPEIPLQYPASVIGQDTTHAIQVGLLVGYEGLVKEMLAQIQAELGYPLRSIATGGLAQVIPSLKTSLDEIDPWLTLEGILLLGKRFA